MSCPMPLALLLLHLFPSLLFQVHPLHALPTPDPAPIDLRSTTSASAASTIPAFPEQSDVVSASCPLDLPSDLIPSITAACSSAGPLRLLSRSRCCPALAAWLYAAYSPTALAIRRPLPAAGYDLPALPDDSEACAAGAERALRVRGIQLSRANGSCDAAYCFCGVRFRSLECGAGFEANAAEGLWVPAGDSGRLLERDCSQPGLTGCSRCLSSLNQLKVKSNGSERAAPGRHRQECQLMGLTWLLSRNRTRYLATATAVLRVLMATDGVGGSDPVSCSPSRDTMPLAVGTNQMDDRDGFHAASRASMLHGFVPSAIVGLAVLLLLVDEVKTNKWD